MGRLQMNAQVLTDVATMRVADDKGLLAMDESNGTCNKRFATVGILQTEEAPARISRIDCNHAGERGSLLARRVWTRFARAMDRSHGGRREAFCARHGVS